MPGQRIQTPTTVPDGPCVACGSPDDLTTDHRVARSAGGTNATENRQPMCWSCNSSKCAKPMAEWLRRERGHGIASSPIPGPGYRVARGGMVRYVPHDRRAKRRHWRWNLVLRVRVNGEVLT